jgi:hypothetical protein
VGPGSTFFTKNATFDRRFTEVGGSRIDDDFEPAGETLAFLLGGDSLAARVTVARLFEPDHPLINTTCCASSPPGPPGAISRR